MIHCAATIATKDAGRVRIVDHHDAVVLVGEVAQFWQWRDIAFHGENAVGDEKLVAVPVLGFFEDASAIRDVLMLEDFDGGLGKTAAIDDRGVIQLVGDNQIFFAQDRRNGAGIGRESGLKDDAGFCPFEARDLLFEFHVNLHSADDAAHCARADAVFADGVYGSAAKLGMGGEPKIIVRAEVDDFLAIDGGDGLLLALQNAQTKMEMLTPQIFHGVVEIVRLRPRGSDGRWCGHGSSPARIRELDRSTHYYRTEDALEGYLKTKEKINQPCGRVKVLKITWCRWDKREFCRPGRFRAA